MFYYKLVNNKYYVCFYRLLKDYRKEMDSLTLRWGKLLLPLMAHRAAKIHEKALEVVKLELPALLQHQRELVQALIPEFKLVGHLFFILQYFGCKIHLCCVNVFSPILCCCPLEERINAAH